MKQIIYFSTPRVPALKMAAFLTLALAFSLWGGCAASRSQDVESSLPAGKGDFSILEEWGVEITGLRISAAGYVVDFRYRVHDAEKSKPLFVRKTKPYLIQQETGKVLPLYRSAKVGPMRSSYMPKEDRVYTILFANNGRAVKAGDRVTVKIGDFIAEDLVVE